MNKPDVGSVASLLLCALLLLGGCTSRTIIADPQLAPPYPEQATQGPDFDIVVVREGDKIRLVNRTPRTYTNLELWLNQRYVQPIDRIAIGHDNVLSLKGFVNRYGELYPTGSFLRPDRSQRLVLAELYDRENDLRHRLVVQPPGTR